MTEALSILDELRSDLGVHSLSELRSRKIDQASWDGVLRAYGRLVSMAPDVPPKPAGQLRAAIPTNAVSETDEAEIAARALVICHTAAVILPDTISYPRRFLRLAVLLEEAIGAGLVILLPESIVPTDEGEYFNTAMGWEIGELPDSEDERLARARIGMSRLEIAQAMDACAKFPDRLDLAPTSAAQIGQIRELIEVSGPLQAPTDRVLFLPNLLELDTPRFELAPHELVAIRRDGVFESLRVAVAEALRRASAIQDDVAIDPKSARLREVQDFLTAAAADAKLETNRSRVLRSTLIGTTAVGLGCATGALGAIGGIEPAAVAGGASVAGGFLLGWLGGRPASGTRHFQRAVVSLFGEPQRPSAS